MASGRFTSGRRSMLVGARLRVPVIETAHGTPHRERRPCLKKPPKPDTARCRQTARDRGVTGQSAHHRWAAWARLRGGVLGRSHQRPAPSSRRGARRLQGRGMGAPGRRRRQWLQAVVRGGAGEEGGSRQAQVVAQRCQRSVPGHRRGPRRRVHRLASHRSPARPGCRSSAWCSTRSPPAPSVTP